MRILGRLFIFMLLGWGLLFYVLPTGKMLWHKAQVSKTRVDEARSSSFFPLSGEQWLSFSIPRGADLYRIYTHAVLPGDLGQEMLSYTLDYQWLSEDGDILEQRQWHVTTKVSSPEVIYDVQSGENTLRSTRFYADPNILPSRDQALYFRASEFPQARLLRLRIGNADSRIKQVGIRPFQQHQRARKDVDVTWQRLSAAKRELLTKGAMYPNFLLSDYERRNLLSHYWAPIGPEGVLNTDYRMETLYQLDSDAPSLPPETPTADGLFASPAHWVTMILPADQARYRITLSSLPGKASPHSLQLLWQAIEGQQQREWLALMDGAIWEGTLDAGLLQVIPDLAGVMSLSLREGDTWRDITPQKRYSRAFLCTGDSPLQYSLAPGHEAQPLKINARAFQREGEGEPLAAPMPDIKLTLHAVDGVILEQHSLALSEEVSPYQHFTDARRLHSQVFESTSRYLNASPDSHALKIECRAPTLVNLYSRPLHHPIRRELPAQRNHWLSYEEREPAWFSILPDNARILERQKRYHSLLWYFRPRDLNSQIASGQYAWQFLLASAPDALERQVFSARENPGPARMDSRGSAYRPITSSTTVSIAGSSSEKRVQPSAVFIRDNSAPYSAEVWIDGRLALQTALAGKTGRLRLPYLDRGNHRVAFRAKGVQWYINNTADEGQTHLLRSAWIMLRQKAGGSSLEFPLDITGLPQQLGLWLYMPGGAQVISCELNLSATHRPGLQQGHTFHRYQYRVDSSTLDSSIVLQLKNGEVRGPVRLTIPLDADLPAQLAQVRVHCDHPGVLASAGMVTEGLSPYRYFEERYETQ